MVEGIVVKWFKKEGEKVEKGEPLLEVETYKVTDEIVAPESGILRKVMASVGEAVPVGGTLAIIASPDEELLTEVESHVATVKKASGPEPIVAKELNVARTLISPVARKLADKFGLDLSEVEGSGPGGRIVEKDILRIVDLKKKASIHGDSALYLGGTIEPLAGIRKIIADRMSKSAHSTARVLHTIEVDMNEVTKLRAETERKTGLHVSYTPFLIKAVAEALEEHLVMNSILLEDGIHHLENINVGVAVYVKNELLVPVVQDANRKSLEEISKCLNQLVDKAQQGKLSAEDVSNGTFTITNVGMYGIDIQMPIINPPESAILGIGAVIEKPVVIKGKIEIRPTMNISLCFDHRVIDGVPAAKFLKSLRSIIEDPLQHLLT